MMPCKTNIVNHHAIEAETEDAWTVGNDCHSSGWVWTHDNSMLLTLPFWWACPLGWPLQTDGSEQCRVWHAHMKVQSAGFWCDENDQEETGVEVVNAFALAFRKGDCLTACRSMKCLLWCNCDFNLHHWDTKWQLTMMNLWQESGILSHTIC